LLPEFPPLKQEKHKVLQNDVLDSCIKKMYNHQNIKKKNIYIHSTAKKVTILPRDMATVTVNFWGLISRIATGRF
jgi:hypothetical protein